MRARAGGKQFLGRRNVVCDMHFHVEVPRPEARIDLMNRLLPFIPTLLALSASSPFWQGRATVPAGYRFSAFGEMPCTGLPEQFDSEADYARYVEIMTRAGAIADACFLWWTLRPSVKYPTLELRVAGACTRLGDSIAIAALYRCLMRLAERRPELNRRLTGATACVPASSTRSWGVAVSFATHLDRLLALVAGDAEALGCASEVAASGAIVAGGTSADWQTAVFAAARGRGLSDDEALSAVADWIAATTISEIG